MVSKQLSKIADIYVILHNDTEVYVGYSRDIIERWRVYKCAYGNELLPSHEEKVTQYMVKHGWYNFSIELVEEKVSTIGMQARLAYWVSAYQMIGCYMLNNINLNVDRRDRCYTVVCDRCNNPINSTDLARHQRTTKCKLAHRGFGDMPPITPIKKHGHNDSLGNFIV
tara:strand:+ start:32 stop:535 length:504 start_codon:yes stop_codon:yes gene_type:complete